MTTTEEKAALAAMRTIVAAFEALSPATAGAVFVDLWKDESPTLTALGGGLMRGDTTEEIAADVAFSAWYGDGREVIEKLGDAEPWATIRRGLYDMLLAAHLDGAPPWPNDVDDMEPPPPGAKP